MSFRGQIICYAIAGDDVAARELGSHQELVVTPELRAAIAADLAHQAAKALEPG